MHITDQFLNVCFRAMSRASLRFVDETLDRPCAPRQGTGLLYMHIPFCESLCPYCSFHRYVYDANAAAAYFAALRRELQLYHDHGFDFQGLYVGGGTPTIALEELAETLGLARSLFHLREISVETNPNHLTERHIECLRENGVNRLSVGVQSFDNTILQQIGRYEKYGSRDRILQQLSRARGRFDTLNVDLIFNFPGQTGESLDADLRVLADLLPEQVTYYPLMAARSVRATLQRQLGRLDPAQEKTMYFRILDRLDRHYTPASVWCFSRQATMIDEYIIGYDWYVGAGSGAFGYWNDRVHVNTFSLPDYAASIAVNRFPVTGIRHFSPRENWYYCLLMKLFGLSLDKGAFERAFGLPCSQALRLELAVLKAFGAVIETPAAIELTPRGRYCWLMAMREFFIGVDSMRDRCRRALEHTA